MAEFNGHTEEEVQDQIQEGKESKEECSQAVIFIPKK